MWNKIIRVKKNVIVAFFAVILILLIQIIFWQGWKISKDLSYTLSEAKNIEFALRVLATEYYGMDQPIYDPLTPDGLAEGVGQVVAELSGAEGELVLGSWDAARRAPRSFIYTKEKTVVTYNYDEQSGNCWSMYYQFRKAALPGWAVPAETTAAE